MFFMHQKSHQEAHNLLNMAAQKLPQDVLIRASLAQVNYYLGNHTAAFESLVNAMTLDSNVSEIWYNFGVLYEKCKQPDDALEAYAKVIELEN
jgi:Tfp pilus assembly protein PilF